MKRFQATHWRDRVALSASAAIGQSSDEEVIHRARTLVDQSWLTVVTGFVLLAVLLGALIGWTTTAVILRPAEGPVNPVVALLLIAGVPWLLVGLRSVVLLALRWRVSSGHLLASVSRKVIRVLLRSVRRDSADSPFSLANSVVLSITDMLAGRSGSAATAAGRGAFWTTYAVIAIATIWISTAHVALGFGWESSWVSSDSYRAVVDSAPLIGSDELTPVAIDAPAHDPAVMATRRAWLRFISDGVTIYLLLPMLALTLIHGVNWRRQSDVWRPLLWRPLSGVGPCTHIVRLARAKCTNHLPAPLDGLVDLGSLDVASDLQNVLGIVRSDTHRLAVLGWLPAEPNHTITILRTLAEAAGEQRPLLVLDGSTALRQHQTDSAVASLDAWHLLAWEADLALVEYEFAELTDEMKHRLSDAVGQEVGLADRRESNSRNPPDESGSIPRAIGSFLRLPKSGRRAAKAVDPQAGATGGHQPNQRETAGESRSKPRKIQRFLRWPKTRRRTADAAGQQAAATSARDPNRRAAKVESGSKPRRIGSFFQWPQRRARAAGAAKQQAAAAAPAIRTDPSQPDTENRANTEDRRTVRVHHFGYSSAIRWERPGRGCPSTDRPWTGFTRRG